MVGIALLLVAIVSIGTATAKSLYVIANINRNPTPINAYDIQGNILVYQATYNVPYHGWGGVGLAIDADSKTLFVTYESSNIIELINATTMSSVGYTTAPGASNLAGIDVDDQNNIVYTVNRNTNKLYAYVWDPNTKTLTLKSGYPINLPNCSQAYGISFDDQHSMLYVADGNGYVRVYNVGTWTEADRFKPSHRPVGIAVDPVRGYVYTVAGYMGSNLLSQYNLNSKTEKTVDMGHGGMGVAVDWSTGLVYVSGGYSGDDVSVWNPNTLTQTYSTGDIGDPTGLCVPQIEVGYNPLHLSKDDGYSKVCPGQQITYNICFDNAANNYNVHNVTIVDRLPTDVSFVSATAGGIYDSSNHTVTWQIGTLTAKSPQQCVMVTVKVNSNIIPPKNITNYCTIDSDETPPTTKSDVDRVMPCGAVSEFPPIMIAILTLTAGMILVKFRGKI